MFPFGLQPAVLITLSETHFHNLKSYLESFETADRRLREDVAVQRAQSESDVGLRIPELDSLLLEITCKTLQIIRAWLLVVAKAEEALKIKIKHSRRIHLQLLSENR
jgi:hypothetical protein